MVDALGWVFSAKISVYRGGGRQHSLENEEKWGGVVKFIPKMFGYFLEITYLCAKINVRARAECIHTRETLVNWFIL